MDFIDKLQSIVLKRRNEESLFKMMVENAEEIQLTDEEIEELLKDLEENKNALIPHSTFMGHILFPRHDKRIL